MRRALCGMIPVALVLAGCASDDPLAGQRTVFSNPHAAVRIDTAGVGPQCDVLRGSDATCLGVPLTRSGGAATTGARQHASLTRAQRRILRQRAELLKMRAEEAASRPAPAPPPPPPAIADAAEQTDAP